ncbi:hypothetical protein T11_7973 [Trichinella zimbabwensis]|uniref:F-box domain-containing protein n=1 Tax=Trichinella zimbabwensis TaxID=268475 RepID=A0A0V1HMY3_9BILA|nr:hypothetical protein T11_7973 [Trichinella zimbabwensis]
MSTSTVGLIDVFFSVGSSSSSSSFVQASEKMTIVNDLPEELLVKIFLLLSPNDWLSSILTVCRRWRRVMLVAWANVRSVKNVDNLHGELYLADGTRKVLRFANVADAGRFYSTTARHVRQLTLELRDGMRLERRRLLDSFCRRCVNLRSLTLSGALCGSIDWTIGWLDHMTKLKELAIDDCSRCWQHDDEPHCCPSECRGTGTARLFSRLAGRWALTKLELKVSVSCLPTVDVLQQVLRSMPLEILKLQLLQPVRSAYAHGLLRATASGCATTLRHFGLFCYLTEPLDARLCKRLMRKLTKLHTLDLGLGSSHIADIIDDRSHWTGHCLSALCGLDSLRCLTLRMTDFTPLVEPTPGLGRLFNHLVELSLNKCRFGSRRQLCSLLASCGALRRLSFGDTRLPMDHLHELIVSCPSLRRVEISLQQEPFSVIDTLTAVQQALHDRRAEFDSAAAAAAAAGCGGSCTGVAILPFDSDSSCCPSSSSTLVIQIGTLRLDASQGELLKNAHFCCLQVRQRPLFTTVTVDLTGTHRYGTAAAAADQQQSIS